MALNASPTFALQPSAEQVAVAGNYLGAADLNLLNQYLPDLYEKEFERYGNRSVSSFLRLVSAEIPSTSDLIKWTEEGRLHIKYNQVGSIVAAGADTGTFTVNDAISGGGNIAIRVGQTVVMSQNDGSGTNKALVTGTNPTAGTFDVAFYEVGGFTTLGTGAGSFDVTVFIYGSEFAKGTAGMNLSLEAEEQIFDNKPIILKDKYAVSGSDMAQIGWIEVDTDSGSGYLWYLKSASDTRARFDDYLETSMIEAVPMKNVANLAALPETVGSKGVFYEVEDRGNVFGGGNPTTLAEWDSIVQRLDRQGAIEENVIFLNRQFGFDVDDMLAAQNSQAPGGTSYGLFDNDKDMALNLGFTGFRRGYDFYKTDWKYLNDATMRADLPSGGVNGLLVPAGSKTVYDQVLGKNAKRPYLHVRYRASATEDRKLKSWVTGSAGQAATNDVDEMEINFLSERCICTMGANNFMLFQD